MSETLAHTQLVQTLVEWALENICTTPGLCLYCDNQTVLKTEKPPSIDGYYSDIFAVNCPQTLTVVGEAKTIPDIDTERTFNQITAFLRFLAVSPTPQLVFATPWQAGATAKNIVRRARLKANAPGVKVIYITD